MGLAIYNAIVLCVKGNVLYMACDLKSVRNLISIATNNFNPNALWQTASVTMNTSFVDSY